MLSKLVMRNSAVLRKATNMVQWQKSSLEGMEKIASLRGVACALGKNKRKNGVLGNPAPPPHRPRQYSTRV
jgi:hypothetical protein